MLTEREHLLVVLVEECAEVAQAASKCLRFGMDDRNVLEPDGPTNRERLVAELNDLHAMLGPLAGMGVLPTHWFDPKKVEAKRQKVMKFMRYARERGTTQPPPPDPGKES